MIKSARFARFALAPLTLALVSCLSSSTTGPATNDGGVPSGGDGAVTPASFAGTYSATYTGTYQNTSPNTASGTATSSATITVTNLSASEIELTWQIAPNPPSGTAIFDVSGATGGLIDSGIAAAPDGAAPNGQDSCFTGLVNGNTQKNCCTQCTISFSGTTFSQPNAGFYTGTNAAGVAYTGTYSGVWTGTIQ